MAAWNEDMREELWDLTARYEAALGETKELGRRIAARLQALLDEALPHRGLVVKNGGPSGGVETFYIREAPFQGEIDPFFTVDQVLGAVLGGGIYFAYTPRLTPEEALTLLTTYYGDEGQAKEALERLEPLSEEDWEEL
ncbi:hypothetical protein MN1_500 [Thermus phage MN1]|nr:hypothetical protein MN1_500 [Thermus phage MN1]